MKLRQWREKEGLSQRALGETLGVTQQMVAKWEKKSKRSYPRFPTILRIIKLTGGGVGYEDWN